MNTQQTSTLPCILSRAATQYPNSPAIITDKMTLTYHNLSLLVEETASQLQAKGILRGERVGIFLPNSYEYAVLLMAMLRAGVVAVPVNTRWPQNQIANALQSIGCQNLIIADEIVKPEGLDSINLIQISEIVKTDYFTKPGNSPLEGGQGGVTDLDSQTNAPAQSINPNQDATIIFTSGSAGKPKAALHTYKNHYYSALGSNQNITIGPGDRWLLSLPLYHVGGLGVLFRAALGGGAVVIPGAGIDLVDAIALYEVSHISLVATQLYRLLQKEMNNNKMGSLKAVLLGGSAIPTSLIKNTHERKIPLFTTYGSTEMASQVATTSPGDPLNKLYTSGKLLPHRELMISPEGEILVRGETLFKGYLTKKGLRNPFSRNGWFATGDLGEFDSGGYLLVTGRKDNMFISGGENIQPEEIELALCKIDGVLQAVVVPVADAEFGQRPVAFVKMQTGRQLDADFLSKQLAQHIARFKIPDRFLAWPQRLLESDMKVDRKYFLNSLKSQCNAT
ncbi:MAG: o-succinylbenzoate--CoA ligase [bacterium]